MERRGLCGISTTRPDESVVNRLNADSAKQSTPQYHSWPTRIPTWLWATIRMSILLGHVRSAQTACIFSRLRSTADMKIPSDSFIGLHSSQDQRIKWEAMGCGIS